MSPSKRAVELIDAIYTYQWIVCPKERRKRIKCATEELMPLLDAEAGVNVKRRVA